MRRLVPSACLALLVLSVWHFLDDRAARGPIADAAARFTMDVRRPVETGMIAYAPSADFAAQVFASSAIGDALGTRRLTGLSATERRAWLDVPLDLDEELQSATELQLSSIRRNPGWPLHRYFLGKLAFVRERRSLGADIEPLRWYVPLVSAWHDAPTHEPTVETLAGVILEAWRLLPQEKQTVASEVLQAAFVDPRFASLAFDIAVDVIGSETAFTSLPDKPSSLMAAARSLGRRGDIHGAAELYSRWENAEWAEREADLALMRREKESGDWRGLLSASFAWASKHDIHAFASPAAVGQAEEVLRLWPRDQVGTWGSDPRGEFLRFFLDGRLDSVDAAVLESTVSAISGAPSPVRARIALAAGNPDKAEALLARAGSEGSFEWTDYFVDLARRAVARNDLDAAIEAIDRISPSARGECDVVVVRRLAGEAIDAPEPVVTNDGVRVVDEAWSANGMLGFCVDPVATGEKALEVEIVVSSPVLLEWGLNGGRRGTVLVEDSSVIELPFASLTGRNVLYTRVLWGDGPVSRVARVR